jgi:hypothetical protein
MSPLKVMISSRCATVIPLKEERGTRLVTLTEIRAAAKERLEGIKFGHLELFEVWINEFAPSAGLDFTSWNLCTREAEQADIFVYLDSPDPGWFDSKRAGSIGICHAELQAAVESGRRKVRGVKIPYDETGLTADEVARNKAFAAYKRDARIEPFRPEILPTDTIDGAVDKLVEAVFAAVVELTKAGRRASSAAQYSLGDAMTWAEMDISSREGAMEVAVEDAMSEMELSGSYEPHVLAEAYSLSWARERLGKPFLSPPSGSDGRPLLIACYKSITENQARSFLGHAAVMTVITEFGLFARDLRTHTQVVFLKHCRDKGCLKQRLLSAEEWLKTIEESVKDTRDRRVQIEVAMHTAKA